GDFAISLHDRGAITRQAGRHIDPINHYRCVDLQSDNRSPHCIQRRISNVPSVDHGHRIRRNSDPTVFPYQRREFYPFINGQLLAIVERA
ncbi:hypothetical protein Q5692_40330, partial [Microcoleus sp. C2C3]